MRLRHAKVRAGGLLLGLGLGGFIDGIVLRQLLQWHQMLSAVLPPESMEAMRQNMAADGLFHLATWLLTLAGVFALWSAVRGPGPLPRTRTLVGYMLVGWGVFNLVEGAINHHVLVLHHVRDLPQHVPVYDWIFLLGGGVGFVLLGLALVGGRHGAAYREERRSGVDRRLSY